MGVACMWALLRQRPTLALVVATISCFVHPTAGVLLLGLTATALTPQLWHRRQTRFAVVWGGTLLIGACPLLSDFIMMSGMSLTGDTLGYGEWYSQLIKDEADDFSILAQFVIRPRHLAWMMSVVALTLALYARVFRHARVDPVFWYALTVPVLFLVLGVAEVLLAVVLPTPFVHLLAGLTLGYRLLSFAFYPLLVIVARLTHAGLTRLIDQRPERGSGRACRRLWGLTATTVLVGWGGFLAFGVWSGHLDSAWRYARWAVKAGSVEGVDAYYRALAEAGEDRFAQPEVFRLADPAVTYPGERNVWRISRFDRSQPLALPPPRLQERLSVGPFLDLIDVIRRHVPPGDGLIVPPYLRYFRDSLSQYPVFFQEHHDGNLMMGSPRFMRFWNTRMQDLLGLTYEGLPSKVSRLSYTVMRQAFLGLDDVSVSRLSATYPGYSYFVTEREHRLELPIVGLTNHFIVYQLGGSL